MSLNNKDRKEFQQGLGNDRLGDKATTEINNKVDTGSTAQLEAVQFDLTAALAAEEGLLVWNADEGTLNLGLPGGSVNLQIGQEQLIRATNKQGVQINNGQAVFISGAAGANPFVQLANAAEITGVRTLAVATENVGNNQKGYFTTFGLVRNLNTSAFDEGDELFLDSTSGDITKNRLDYPNFRIRIGYCLRKHADEGVIFVNIQPDQWLKRFQVMKEPTGFPDLTASSVSFDEGTRTFTINPTGSEFDFFIKGTQYRISSSDVVGVNKLTISDVEGLHYIYHDGEDLLETTTWNNNLLSDYALIAFVHWDATNSKQIYFAEERHSLTMDWATHVYLHNSRGTALETGGELGSLLVDQSGALDSHAQFANAITSFYDEDLRHSHTARGSTENIPVYYRFGADVDLIWRMNESASFPVLSTGTGRAAWNELSGGNWQLTEVGNNQFVLAHVFAYNDLTRKFGIVMGQAVYNTISAARLGAGDEINNIILEGAPVQEIVFLGTLIFQTADAYGNTPKSRIRSTDTGDDYIDLRGSVITRSGSSVVVTDHNTLTNLQGGEATERYHLTAPEHEARDVVYTLTTINATPVNIADIAISEGEVISIEIDVVANKSDSSARAVYKKSALFYRAPSGNVTQQGSTNVISEIESDASWDCVFVANTGTQTIDVQVTGISATINWQGLVKINKL